MSISLVVTVLNEGSAIHRLLDSIVAQSLPPDEVIIVDGGSTDDTVDRMQAYADRLPLQVILSPGANISQGRNLAIAAAQGDIIAITDAGTQLSPNWLHDLTHPLRIEPHMQVVSGWFVADPHTAFEVAMGATVLPMVDEIEPEQFLPSSRSIALRKHAWQQVEGYPEWLDYCEDLVFDFKLRRRFGKFGWAPAAVARFRPRSTLMAFGNQHYRYSRGDGKADLWRARHAIRYGTYLLAGPSLLYLGRRIHPLFHLGPFLGFAYYLHQPYRRLLKMWRMPLANGRLLSRGERLYTLALIPVIRIVGDIAKMMGYPAGIWWRWRQQRKQKM